MAVRNVFANKNDQSGQQSFPYNVMQMMQGFSVLAKSKTLLIRCKGMRKLLHFEFTFMNRLYGTQPACDCYCSVNLLRGAVGWSAVCVCGIS